VLFEMLTGRLPFVGTDQQELALAHIRETPPNASDFNPNVPVHLDRILQKVMSKEPASRYRTADQLGRILISYRRQGQVTTDQVPEVGLEEPRVETAATYPPTQAPAAYAAPPYSPSDRPSERPAQSIPDPRSEAATNVYSQVLHNSSPATMPSTPAVSSQYYQPLRPPDSMIQSRYRAAEPPQQLDLVTLVLAFLAFIAVMLLIPLWIAVYQAWAG
jgi:serine/threonine protein kinase